MRMKKLAVMALATALSVGSVMTASAAWLQEGSNWRYQNDNGTFQTGTWFRDADGRWYHFDNNGIMQKGWFQDADGKWYFLAYNGVMQVGLIKVDNQVYYMGTSGDLFIGDMKIGNTTYNFGLYGTTNGQPSVPASATYGGNGNQSLNGGGGGSSSGGSGGGSTTTTPTDVKEAVSNVQDVANDFTGSESIDKIVVGEIKEDGSNYKVAVSIETKKPEKEELLPAFVNDAKETVREVVGSMLADLADETDVVITVPAVNGKDIKQTYSAAEWQHKLDVLVENYISVESYKNNSTKTATVVVKLDGADVTYSISLAK